MLQSALRNLSSTDGLGNKHKILLIVLNGLIILGGVFVIFNPFESAMLLLKFFGGFTVMLGISELIFFFVYRRASKKLGMTK